MKTMMDIHESTQDFRHLAAKSTPPPLSDDDDEMVLNYSDSEDDRSSKVSKNENFKDALDLLDKGTKSPGITSVALHQNIYISRQSNGNHRR